ncbi:EamA family transporter [candidate division GN15 bacterium]|nr:EamA family transporter [candidate division GN15 bacterium]
MSRPADKPPIPAMATLVLGAVMISFAPIFVKLVGQEALGPTAIAFWRNLFGGITLMLLTLVSGRSLILPKTLWRFALLAGFVFFLDLFVWHKSIIYTGAGMATILGNTQVFATSVLGVVLFREKLTLRFIIAAFSAMGGVVLLVGVGGEVEFSTTYLKGVGFGLLTGVAYASYLITLKTASRQPDRLDPVVFMTWTSFFSAFFLGITGLLEPDPFIPPTLGDFGIVLALGVTVQALAWIVIMRSLALLEASRTGLVLLLQPTLATVWGMLFFAEEMGPTQLVGAAITLAAIYVGSLRAAKFGAAAPVD